MKHRVVHCPDFSHDILNTMNGLLVVFEQLQNLKMSWNEYHNILIYKRNMLRYCKHKNTVLLKSRVLESK